MPLSNNDFTPISFNIMYINNLKEDSVTTVNHLKWLDHPLCSGSEFKILEPLKSDTFYCWLYSYLLDKFNKVGRYKVIFTFRLSRYNMCYKDLQTKPIYIYVRNPNLY
jgi:hypothetical protein